MAAVEKGVALWSGICGILLLLCGIGNVIAGGLFSRFIGSLGGLYASGSGFWSGAALIIAAILGIATWPVKNQGLLIGFLILAIITIILSAVQCVIASLVVVIFNLVLQASNCHIGLGRCVCSSGGTVQYYSAEWCSNINLIYGAWVSLAVFSGLGAVFSLAGSIISCVGLCGARSERTGAVVVQPVPAVSMVTTYAHQQTAPQQYPMEMQSNQFPQGTSQAPPAYNDGSQYMTK